jgi:hypothetical protein
MVLSRDQCLRKHREAGSRKLANLRRHKLAGGQLFRLRFCEFVGWHALWAARGSISSFQRGLSGTIPRYWRFSPTILSGQYSFPYCELIESGTEDVSVHDREPSRRSGEFPARAYRFSESARIFRAGGHRCIHSRLDFTDDPIPFRAARRVGEKIPT